MKAQNEFGRNNNDSSPEFMRSFEKFKESSEHQYTFTIVYYTDNEDMYKGYKNNFS